MREFLRGHVLIGQEVIALNLRRLDTERKFFTLRVEKHQQRFLRELVDVSPLEVFKARLELDDFKVYSGSKYSMIP